MLRILKTLSADTRSADEKVTKEKLLKQSQQHIFDVMQGLEWMGDCLYRIGQRHDYTKIENIDEFHADFKYVQGCCKGKVAEFKQMHWFKDLHLKERHHLTDRVPEDVTLFDAMEMIVDMVMASKARGGEIYYDSLDGEMLQKAFKNTIELLKSQVEVVG